MICAANKGNILFMRQWSMPVCVRGQATGCGGAHCTEYGAPIHNTGTVDAQRVQ